MGHPTVWKRFLKIVLLKIQKFSLFVQINVSYAKFKASLAVSENFHRKKLQLQ